MVAQNIWNQDQVFDPDEGNNDWIILKLDSPLNFNEDVQPACLPTQNWFPELDASSRCIVSGWGLLEYPGESQPTILQWVEIPVVTNDVCQDRFDHAP